MEFSWRFLNGLNGKIDHKDGVNYLNCLWLEITGIYVYKSRLRIRYIILSAIYID